MGDTTQLTIGACSVSLGGIDLGHTKGGVKVKYTPEYADIQADLYGNTPVDKRLVGEMIEVTLALAEWDLEATLNAAMPVAGTESATKRQYGSHASESLLDRAAELVLHPLRLDASDRSEDIVVYKAVVASAVELNYENQNQKVMEVTFIGLVDTDKSEGNLLFMIGDSTT